MINRVAVINVIGYVAEWVSVVVRVLLAVVFITGATQLLALMVGTEPGGPFGFGEWESPDTAVGYVVGSYLLISTISRVPLRTIRRRVHARYDPENADEWYPPEERNRRRRLPIGIPELAGLPVLLIFPVLILAVDRSSANDGPKVLFMLIVGVALSGTPACGAGVPSSALVVAGFLAWLAWALLGVYGYYVAATVVGLVLGIVVWVAIVRAIGRFES